MYKGRNGSTEHSKGNKVVVRKRTEDGYKWNAKTSTTIYTKRKTAHSSTEEEVEGPTSS